MSPPIHEPNTSGGGASGRRSRHSPSRSVAAVIRLCSKNQSPWRISSVMRRRSWRTSSVCQRSVTSSAIRSSTSSRSRREEQRVVEPRELLRDADVREQNGACASPRSDARSGRAGSTRGVRALGVASRDAAERVVERLRRDPAVPRVVAPPAQPVQLLGEVRELELEPERAQDERLLARGQRRRRRRRRRRRAAPSGRRGGCARRARAATGLPARRAPCRGACPAGGRRGGAAQRCPARPKRYESSPSAASTSAASGSIVRTCGPSTRERGRRR